MSIYYEKRGSGPILVISQSGEGDAGRSVDLVDRLADDYTVVTYDRRGLSRSAMDGRVAGVTVTEHADDLHHLLTELTDQPVRVLGSGIGAVIGLHLAIGHPAQVGLLVAHEPAAPSLLPGEERLGYERELAEIQEIHRRDGVAAALKAVARSAGVDLSHAGAESGLTPQPLTPRRVVNFGFLIEHDFTALSRDTVDHAALRDTTVRIVPAHGRATPRTAFAYRCAVELAALLGRDLTEFPGGHDGDTTHPRAYAAHLLEVLD
ncbi:Pimeloyl-ACP methyl ester carboxylesterase [Nonomuraea solani]|uniref:Pimeloyl-ACP methyl ester carboxylesterase n=1 Tax=Nonomuraea solani TaxID=1144553 RepID=A0A1H6EDB0_9ACTN|nr:alpha/beta hydrolase [Nonomuraea solani]SEG95241.1 Pimeloyl-ACP methyl ester carboxylesterase [Nonomuraea solani]